MPKNEVSIPIKIAVRAIISKPETNERWRIIYADAHKTILCLMDVNYLKFRTVMTSALLEALQMQTGLIVTEEEAPVIDISTLPNYAKEKYQRYQAIIISLVKQFGPEFTEVSERNSKKIISKIAEQNDCSEKTVRKIFRQYLQGGLTEHSVIDGRIFKEANKSNNTVKPGRKPMFGEQGILLTEEDYAHFNEMIKYKIRNYGLARGITWKYCYERMLELYYRITVETEDGISLQLLPINQRPTFNQFYRYARNRVSPKAHAVANTSELEYLNNQRLIHGSVRTNQFGPGDVFEIDACETDVALVSRDNPGKSVGRAIVYIIVDVYTGTIMSVSVAFNNNSLVGLTNAVANLIADKTALCEKHEVILPTTELWPSGFIPASVRIDHGADFTSKNFIRICQELGISVDTVPVMNGSMKGTVEHCFSTINERTGIPLIQKGQITRRYDSKHHEEAILNIEDFARIVFEYVIYHNNRYIPSRPKEKEQIDDNVPSIPAKMWQYYTSRFGSPRLAPPRDTFLYTLMIPAKGSISRRKPGIGFSGLFYDCDHIPDIQTMREHSKGRIKRIEIRYDPRTTSYIYVLRDGKLISCPLNRKIPENASYADMTWASYEDFKKAGKKMDHEHIDYNIANRSDLNGKIEGVVAVAEQRHSGIKNDTHNLRENRAAEKEATTVEGSLQNRFIEPNEANVPQVATVESEYLEYTNGENTETEEARRKKITQSALDYLYDD